MIGGLILQNNDPADVNDPEQPNKAMANGQFIFATRAGYDALGGHERVSGEILDDVGFAKACKADKLPFHLVYGRALFRCRMYNSFGEIWQGWTKNLFAGLHYNAALAVFVCVGLFWLNLLPFVVLAVSMPLYGCLLYTSPSPRD